MCPRAAFCYVIDRGSLRNSFALSDVIVSGKNVNLRKSRILNYQGSIKVNAYFLPLGVDDCKR
jgi:hypothetical protein